MSTERPRPTESLRQAIEDAARGEIVRHGLGDSSYRLRPPEEIADRVLEALSRPELRPALLELLGLDDKPKRKGPVVHLRWDRYPHASRCGVALWSTCKRITEDASAVTCASCLKFAGMSSRFREVEG